MSSLPEAITLSSELQIGRSTYAFRSSQRELRNGEVEFAFWQSHLDRSDRFVHTGLTGLHSLPILVVNICPPVFGDAGMPKNKPLDQNYLRMMINMHRPYFVLRAINSIGRILLLLQADDETTCLGLHT